MKRVRTYGVMAVGATAALGLGLLAGPGSASADDGFADWGQPSANPRDGVEDNVLAGNLRESSVAWGQLPLTNPDTQPGQHPLRLQHLERGPAHPGPEGGLQDRARQERLPRPRRPPLPVPGPRGRPGGATSRGSTSTRRTRPRGSPRRRHRRRRRPAARPSTASPGTRSPSSCCSRRSRRRPRAASSRSRSTAHGNATSATGAPVRARFGWLRGHPERLRTATSGSSRTSAARRPVRQQRQGPEQLRLPVPPDGPRPTSRRAAPCRPCRCSGPTGRRRRRRSCRPTPATRSSADCTPTARASPRSS